MKSLSINTACLVLLGFLVCARLALAEGPTLTSEGVAGERDKERRDPILSVSRVVEDGVVRLLADAYVPNTDFAKYPLQFDFYVNRQFFTSQLRSPELTGPVGVNVPSQVAAPPFNFTVVARVLHPNRTFTTVINAAVFASSLDAVFDCTLTRTADGAKQTYQANGVNAAQEGSDSFTLSFDAKNDAGDSISVLAAVTTAGTSANSTLSLTQSDETQMVGVSGTIERQNSALTSLSLASSDGATALSCK
jgi:hypothetical protein